MSNNHGARKERDGGDKGDGGEGGFYEDERYEERVWEIMKRLPKDLTKLMEERDVSMYSLAALTSGVSPTTIWRIQHDTKREPRNATLRKLAEGLVAAEDGVGKQPSPSPVKGPLIMPFGEAVRYRRKKLGMTQEELAHALNLHPTTIGKIEQREHPPQDKRMLRLLAEGLKGTEEELRAGLVPPNFPANVLLPSYDGAEDDPLQREAVARVLAALAGMPEADVRRMLAELDTFPDHYRRLVFRQFRSMVGDAYNTRGGPGNGGDGGDGGGGLAKSPGEAVG